MPPPSPPLATPLTGIGEAIRAGLSRIKPGAGGSRINPVACSGDLISRVIFRHVYDGTDFVYVCRHVAEYSF